MNINKCFFSLYKQLLMMLKKRNNIIVKYWFILSFKNKLILMKTKIYPHCKIINKLVNCLDTKFNKNI